MARSTNTIYTHTCDRCDFELVTDQQTAPGWQLLILNDSTFRPTWMHGSLPEFERELCPQCVESVRAWASMHGKGTPP